MKNSFRYLVVGVVLIFSCHLQAQEWLFKTPEYFRLKGGTSDLCVDKIRQGVLFDGGPYDTYYTRDGAITWERIFDMRMFFLDVASSWKIDDAGTWYYTGKVYLKKTVNLVSVDAGKTFRYLIVDTNHVPFPDRWETEPTIIRPHTVAFDLTSRTPDYTKWGFYSSCDAGLTWSSTQMQRHVYGAMFFNSIGNNKSAFLQTETDGGTSRNTTHNEYDFCNKVWNTTTVPFNGRGQYFRLGDSRTVVEYSDNAVSFGIAPIRVTHEGSADTLNVTHFADPNTGKQTDISVVSALSVNDTMAIFAIRGGVIATYGLQGGFNIVDVPPYLNKYQQVVDMSVFGDRVLFRTVMPQGTSNAVDRWTLLNLQTGELSRYSYPGNVFASRTNSPGKVTDNQRAVAFTDSTWMAALGYGELMITTDAGRSWKFVNNISRDPRWGEAWVAVNRLFDRGDGTMAVLTEQQRLLLPDTQGNGWTIRHMGPFSHYIVLHRDITLNSTGSNHYFGEDFRGSLRLRYGPSTLFFRSRDTMYASGDKVVSYTSQGDYIDTVLPRRARYIKRISPRVVACGMDSVYLEFDNSNEWIYVSKHWPYSIHGADTVRPGIGDLVVADNGDVIAGLRGIGMLDTSFTVRDSIPGGLITSADNGGSWVRGSVGIDESLYISSLAKLPSGTLLCIGSEVYVDPTEKGKVNRGMPHFYQESNFKINQAYIFRSTDNGRTWTKKFTFPGRDVLPRLDVRFYSMPGGILAVHPDAGFAKSQDDGTTWIFGDSLYIGNVSVNDAVFTDDGFMHLATSEGYVKVRTDQFVSVSEQRAVTGGLQVHISNNGILKVIAAEIPADIRLFGLDGNLFLQSSDSNNPELDVSGFPRGTYIVLCRFGINVRSTVVQL